MRIVVFAAVLLLSFGDGLSQYESMYPGSNLPEVPYDNTREEILSNFFNNKPLLSYVPVYNTDYGHWNGENQTLLEETKQTHLDPSYASPKTFPEAALQKLNQDITKLTTNMHALSEKTKTAYENKLKELNEVKKLGDDLKVALQTANVLKNGLREEEKLLSKSLQNGYPVTSPSGLDQFLKMMEGLESTVRSVNCKFEGKPSV